MEAYKTNFLVIGIVGLGIGVSLLLIRRYFAGGVCTAKAMMIGKTVVITGANTGIGIETALDLAKRKAKVILACRDKDKGKKAASKIIEKTGNQNVVFRSLDLSSLDSVRKFAFELLAEEPTIDILINNAGVMRCPYWKTVDGYEMQLGVNHLGHFLLTNLLLERLMQAPEARIVIVSSSFYKRINGIKFDDINSEKSYDPSEAYAQSKLANILFTRALAKRLQGSSVTVNCLHPGVVATELGRHLLKDIGFLSKVFLYCFVYPIFFKTPSQGAQTTIHCTVAEEVSGVSGKYFGDCQIEDLKTAAAVDDDMAERLWRVSAEMVGL